MCTLYHRGITFTYENTKKRERAIFTTTTVAITGYTNLTASSGKPKKIEHSKNRQQSDLVQMAEKYCKSV
jgi:hypothetical protein